MRHKVLSVDLSRCGCLCLRVSFRWCLSCCSCSSDDSWEEELLVVVKEGEDVEEKVSLSEERLKASWK